MCYLKHETGFSEVSFQTDLALCLEMQKLFDLVKHRNNSTGHIDGHLKAWKNHLPAPKVFLFENYYLGKN